MKDSLTFVGQMHVSLTAWFLIQLLTGAEVASRNTTLRNYTELSRIQLTAQVALATASLPGLMFEIIRPSRVPSCSILFHIYSPEKENTSPTPGVEVDTCLQAQ